ncbi:hypothetical protein Noc_0090 [Nitrosococcus oceani ATCC 19707]|uniref:PIN domain-containing protein n=1 Tax=Nitrosococcus oceani (strain ATCC 19707 / BCRC 17464 / JCM 30415 / NCIMB 11848 / C-107) TaxID=323261 RepID=Q3JEX1_NITOC|nr:hypothetical protein Noc_0090 [Nitrosococcus oceani ATCC 19707]
MQIDTPNKKRQQMLCTAARRESEILPYEIGNALSIMIKRKRLTHNEALSAFKITSLIHVRLVAIDIQQALKLAFEFNIYAYGAYFLQCAQSLSCPLITLNKRMKQVSVQDILNAIRDSRKG